MGSTKHRLRMDKLQARHCWVSSKQASVWSGVKEKTKAGGLKTASGYAAGGPPPAPPARRQCRPRAPRGKHVANIGGKHVERAAVRLSRPEVMLTHAIRLPHICWPPF